MPFFIDPYCDYIALQYSNLITTYCFKDLAHLGVDRARFVAAFWKRHPYGHGNTGINFFQFGLEHNELFNSRLGLPQGTPTFQAYVKKCLAPVVERSKHIIDTQRN